MEEEQEPRIRSTCAEARRSLLIVTPSTTMESTLSRPGSGGGRVTPLDRRMNTISRDLFALSFRWLCVAQVSIASSSVVSVGRIEAGTIRYVSSAYLTILFC